MLDNGRRVGAGDVWPACGVDVLEASEDLFHGGPRRRLLIPAVCWQRNKFPGGWKWEGGEGERRGGERMEERQKAGGERARE